MTDIIKTSASAIESFDDSSPFGCQRHAPNLEAALTE